MASLTEFLLARIAEDEAAAHGATKLYRPVGEHQNVYGDWVPIEPVGGDDIEQVEKTATAYRDRGARGVQVVVFYDPERVLAECAAKRRIIELHPCDVDGYCGDGIGLVGCRWLWPCPTLSALALPYADHPDYREEWRP